MSRWLKQIRNISLSVVLFVIILELALRFVDPTGAVALHRDLQAFELAKAADPDLGYALADGTHQFNSWKMTVENGYRVTPATNPDASCTIAFIGDSFTMGAGVDDEAVAVNLIAAELPNVHVINTGIGGYNLDQVVIRQRQTPADGYIYLALANDMYGTIPEFDDEAFRGPIRTGSALRVYLGWLNARQGAINNQHGRPGEVEDAGIAYYYKLQELDQTENVLIFFLTLGLLWEADNTVNIVPMPEYGISTADGHYNAEGNQALAEQMLPTVIEFADRTCDDA